jgi:hypothetical protein
VNQDHFAAPSDGEREATDIVVRLRNTPNWQRESFEHWKSCTLQYDRAPFDAAEEIERLRAASAARSAEIQQLREALTKVLRAFPTDLDMAEAGWKAKEIEQACTAYDAARAALEKQ